MTGVKVQINTKDDNQNEIKGDGYICRRLNSELYEIWSEELQTILLLSTKEFEEQI
jgi:hypothetical protein